MTDPEAKAIIQKIAISTKSFRYMASQIKLFCVANPTYTRRQLYKWIREVNPVLAEKFQAADYGYRER
jgi:hypothetical protein